MQYKGTVNILPFDSIAQPLLKETYFNLSAVNKDMVFSLQYQVC